MEELLRKYIHGTITLDELTILKKQLADMPDSELAELFAKIWDIHDFECTPMPSDIKRLKSLRKQIISKATSTSPIRLFKWATIAAAAVVIAVTCCYYVIRTATISHDKESTVIVQTAAGERATTYLPDGTRVAMNYESQLTWDETSFNRTSRNVSFEGEGFFTVSKNKALPFEIKSGLLEVEVTGTSFNLRWRANKNIAQLYLITGEVKLKSALTGETVDVHPGQLAQFDCQSGKIECWDEPESGLDQTRWRDNELVFNATSLNDVMKELSGCYGTQITAATNVDVNMPFTGTLPGGDLLEAMHAIEVTFDLSAKIHGGYVELTP